MANQDQRCAAVVKLGRNNDHNAVPLLSWLQPPAVPERTDCTPFKWDIRL